MPSDSRPQACRDVRHTFHEHAGISRLARRLETERALAGMLGRLLLTRLLELHTAGRLQFLGKHAELADATAFRQRITIVRKLLGNPRR